MEGETKLFSLNFDGAPEVAVHKVGFKIESEYDWSKPAVFELSAEQIEGLGATTKCGTALGNWEKAFPASERAKTLGSVGAPVMPAHGAEDLKTWFAPFQAVGSAQLALKKAFNGFPRAFSQFR
jgi:hypothetical protein